MRLLLAEDERDLSRALSILLKHNHYTVDAVYDGEAALEYAAMTEYDCIILDIMMPKMDGFTVLKKLRENGNNTPVIVLTARHTTEEKIHGLDLGADDYLGKPFDTGELLARLRAVTRRKGEYIPNIRTFGDLSINQDTFEMSTPDHDPIRLSGREYQIMLLLMDSGEKLVSTEKFMERIWGFDADAEISVVWVYISYLRRKLATLESKVRIKAMRGLGYTLMMEEEK